MQEIEYGLRGEVGVSDQERLVEIRRMYGLIEAEQFTIKTADYEQLYAAAEKSIEIEKYVLGTSRKLDDLHEYLQKNHSGKGWGKHIIDAAIQVMEEQQKEIERLKDYSQKSANVALLAELENENARLRRSLEEIAAEGHSYVGEISNQKLMDENARLREALKFYAESEKHIDPYAYGEFGEKARQALKE